MNTEEDARTHVGSTIAAKYRLLRLIGAGGMGAVYEAEHVFTKRRVAVKRMLPGIALGRHSAERFVREAQAPSTIGHPGIAQVLDGGSDADGSLYLVLELLEGVSMQDALETGPLEVAAITQIGIELLEALSAAHEKGFIHRDIKPDNVFLAEDGRDSVSVKLLDFGIASMQDPADSTKLTRPGSVLGTPQYMSPEQAQGDELDARSDLWAVGAMLYRALAGKAPYEGETYNALIVSIVTKQHLPLAQRRPDLPRALVDVVERAMQKSPAARFETAAEMCAALQAVRFDAAAPRVVAARQPLAATRAESQPWSTVGTVLVMCVLGASAFLALRAKPAHVRPAAAQLPAARIESPAPVSPVRAASAVLPPSAPELPPSPKIAAEPRAVAPSEGLPPEALAPVLARMEPELQRCLEDSVVAQMLAGGPKPEPLRLDVELQVAPSGQVDGTLLHGRAPDNLKQCVRAQLLAAQFPRAGAPSRFRYPLVLAATVVGQ